MNTEEQVNELMGKIEAEERRQKDLQMRQTEN